MSAPDSIVPFRDPEDDVLFGDDRPLPPSVPVEDGPVFTDLRDVEARDVDWLDRPFLPFGELVTNNADGDTGKGLFAVHNAARVSRGEFEGPRMVLFVVAEDAFDTVLKPRLMAAGANLEHVRVVTWRRDGFPDPMRIPDDIPELRRHIAEMGVRMIVVDPLLSHLTGNANSHIDHDVRLALQPLIGLAQATGCLVLGNGNFSKDKSRGARAAAAASTAFTNVPRVGLAMAPDDEDPDVRIVEVIKSNIGPKGIGRNYRVKAVEVEGLADTVPMLVAEGAATKAVDDLIAEQPKGKRVPPELLRALVLAELETGEKSRGHLNAVAAEKLAANPDTVYKVALTALRLAGTIAARKDGMTGGWFWRLTNEVPE